jgi:TetR/AcrR family transcriptional regulator
LEQIAHERARDTRHRILESAMQVFSEKGKAGARMHEIAERAGVNQAMLHYYFSTKEGLYEEMLYSIFSDVLGQVVPVFFSDMDADPRLKAERFIDAYIDLIWSRPHLPPIMMRELAGGGQTVVKVVSRVFSEKNIRVPEGFREVIEKGVRDGKLRPVDPEQTAISVIGMSLFYFVGRPLVRLIWGLDPEREAEFVEARKRHIKDLLRHGLFLDPEELEAQEAHAEEKRSHRKGRQKGGKR